MVKMLFHNFPWLKSLKMLTIIIACVLGLMVLLIELPYRQARGFGAGLESGTILATTDYFIEIGKAKPVPNVDLNSQLQLLLAVEDSTRARSKEANILVFLSPLNASLKSYQQAFKEKRTQDSAVILTRELIPSSTALRSVLTKLNQRLDSEASEYSGIHRWGTITFVLFGFLGIMSLLSLISNDAFRGSSNEFSILESSFDRPFFATVATFLDKKYELEKDVEINERLQLVTFLAIFKPDLQALASNRDYSDFLGKNDLFKEIQLAEAFAYFLSYGEGQFQNIPRGVVETKAETAVIAHAMIQWMAEIAKDQKVKRFDLGHQWDGRDWKINLHTVGEPIHASVVKAYSQVLSKGANLNDKNKEPLDFVRTVLRRYTTGFEVTHEDSNLNLVMTFAP